MVSFAPAAIGVYEPPAPFHSKETLTLPAVPREIKSPLSRAELVVIPLASLVVTVGEGGKVLKLFSAP